MDFQSLVKTIVQAVMALSALGAVIYIMISGSQIPGEFMALLGIIIGWYFGKNNVLSIADALIKRSNKKS